MRMKIRIYRCVHWFIRVLRNFRTGMRAAWHREYCVEWDVCRALVKAAVNHGENRQLLCLRTVCEMLLTDRMTTARESSLTVARTLVSMGWPFRGNDPYGPNEAVIRALRFSTKLEFVRESREHCRRVYHYRRKRRTAASA